MIPEIKKRADKGDTKGLRYIFCDSLDVDPTFEKYKDGWEYCLALEGFLDEHNDLSPLRSEASGWNDDYWTMLKSDLMKNFSQKRFEHMKEVAKVYYAEKIRRLEAERSQKKAEAANAAAPEVSAEQNIQRDMQPKAASQNTSIPSPSEAERKASQQRAEEEKAERYRREQAERDAKFEAEQKMRQEERQKQMKEEETKKLVGAAVMAILIIAIVTAVILLIK